MPFIFHTDFPFTWDQVADGLTDADVGITGDGLSGNGGWTVDGDGVTGDTVETAAKRGSDRTNGYRHKIGSGSNNNGGGIQVSFTESEEIWVRYYCRYPVNFSFSSGGYNKQIYLNNGLDGHSYWGVHDYEWGGYVNSAASPQKSGVTFATTMGGNNGDGQWHCFEWHFKMNTVGQTDGIVELWLDGTQIMTTSDNEFRTSGSQGFTNFRMGENLDSSAVALALQDFDDVAVSDSGRIGPLEPKVNDATIYEPPFVGPYHYDNWQPGTTYFPAKGETYVDPVFGSVIKRLTDDGCGSDGLENYNHSYCSLEGKYYFWTNTSNQHVIYRSSDNTVVQTGVEKGPEGHRQWSPVNTEEYFYVSGNGLYKWTVGGSGTLLKDFGATLAKIGGSLNMTDATARYFVVGYSGTIKVWDSVDDVIYTGTSISDPGDGHVSMSPDAKWIFNCPGGQWEAHALDHVANSVGSAVVFWKSTGGDHCAFLSGSDGENYFLRFDNDDDGDMYCADIRDRSALSISAIRTAPGVTKVLDQQAWWFDMHGTNALVGDYTDWFVFCTEADEDRFDNSTFAGPWQRYMQEVLAYNPITNELQRLAHHRSRSSGDNFGNYYYQPRITSSPDFKMLAWTSNMNKNDGFHIDFFAIENYDFGQGGGPITGSLFESGTAVETILGTATFSATMAEIDSANATTDASVTLGTPGDVVIMF